MLSRNAHLNFSQHQNNISNTVFWQTETNKPYCDIESLYNMVSIYRNIPDKWNIIIYYYYYYYYYIIIIYSEQRLPNTHMICKTLHMNMKHLRYLRFVNLVYADETLICDDSMSFHLI